MERQELRNLIRKYQRKYPAHLRQCIRADKILDAINAEIGGNGVESLQPEGAYIDRYYYNIVALYINTGDTYNLTVVYDTEQERFYVTSWGDWLECWERNQPACVY